MLTALNWYLLLQSNNIIMNAFKENGNGKSFILTFWWKYCNFAIFFWQTFEIPSRDVFREAWLWVTPLFRTFFNDATEMNYFFDKVGLEFWTISEILIDTLRVWCLIMFVLRFWKVFREFFRYHLDYKCILIIKIGIFNFLHITLKWLYWEMYIVCIACFLIGWHKTTPNFMINIR